MKKALKIILPLLLALAIVGGAAWYFLLYQPSLTADYYVSRAEKAIAEGRYDRAIKHYSTAESLDESNWEIPLSLAETYRLSGNYTKAEYTLVRAISAFPEELSLYTALSRVYVEQDKLLDAEQMLSRVANESIRSQLAELRPAAPILSPESGYYNDYIEVTASYSDGTVYLMTGGEYPALSQPYTGPVQLERGETTVSAIVVSDSGLVSTLTTCGYTVGRVDEEVTLLDPALSDAVYEILGKSPGSTLMSSELWTITELTLPERVSTLEDLVWFEALESLTAENMRGIDFNPIGQLTTLKKLSLSGCSVDASELETIGTMTWLTELDLSGCALSSVAALAGLTRLEVLELDDNSIGNITPLDEMTQLRSLDLANNAVTSLAVLVDLPALEFLNLSRNPIDSLTPAAGCRQMVTLDLSGCGVSDLSAVSGMTELTELYASSNTIADLTCLAGCTKLSVLDVSDNQITDVSVLAGLPELAQVKLDYNQIAVLPEFPATCALFDLSATYNQLSDISGLAALEWLNYLDIDYNDVRDITVLADCINLVQVNAFANPISDVQPLLDHGIIVNYDPTYVDTYDFGTEDEESESE